MGGTEVSIKRLLIWDGGSLGPQAPPVLGEMPLGEIMGPISTVGVEPAYQNWCLQPGGQGGANGIIVTLVALMVGLLVNTFWDLLLVDSSRQYN